MQVVVECTVASVFVAQLNEKQLDILVCVLPVDGPLVRRSAFYTLPRLVVRVTGSLVA